MKTTLIYQILKFAPLLLIVAIVFIILIFLYLQKRISASRTGYFRRFNRILMKARRAVVDRMVEGFIVLDSRNLVLDYNSAARKILGIPSSNIKGSPAEEVFIECTDLLENLRYSSRKNQNLQVKNGNQVSYYLLDINPLFDKQGKVMGKMLILHDITSLKQTELKLAEARNRAEQSDNLKSAFLANMSHEIRTPMNVIIGFSNLLNDAEVSPEEREEFIEHIKYSGNSLLQLIDDIIDISKLDAGQIVQENSRLSVTRLLSELFAYYNEALQEEGKKDVQLLVNGIGDKTDWIVLADGVKINRILRHLLANAVKFTRTGFIEFGAKMESPGMLLFYVQDSGIGIAREKQGMIFERFSRVMTGTRQEYGGTGMGLAICKGLAELMGGSIWVESNLGSGSTFYVQLPVSQVEVLPLAESLAGIYNKPSWASPPAEVEAPAEPGLIFETAGSSDMWVQENWTGKVVLVIEPEEMVYLNIEMILRQTRVNLVWAKTIDEAMNFLDGKNKPDSIILSANMNEAGPEDSMTSLATRAPGVPVIAVIPTPDSPLGKTCIGMGCRAAITKPVIPIHLLRALRPGMSITTSDLLFLRAN